MVTFVAAAGAVSASRGLAVMARLAAALRRAGTAMLAHPGPNCFVYLLDEFFPGLAAGNSGLAMSL